MKRSTSSSESVGMSIMPLPCMPAFPFRFVVRTTRVLPSKRPRESPIHDFMPACNVDRPSRGMMRDSWIISLRNTT
jgi:hypothetical protein